LLSWIIVDEISGPQNEGPGRGFSTALKKETVGLVGLPTAWFVFLGSQDIQRAPGRPMLKK
jgi:hypothetical protein